MNFPTAPKILKTSDYEKFSFVKFNRNINETNLNKIKKLISEEFKLHLFPILVNEKLQIIDGQHRFTAAKEIGAPIYYIIQENCAKVCVNDIYSVNIAGKKHTIGDKIEMLYKSGDQEIWKAYELFASFNEKFRLPDVVTLCYSHSYNSDATKAMDNGRYSVKNYKQAKELLQEIDKSNIQNSNKARFIFSCSLILHINKISARDLISRIEQNKHLLMNYANRQDVFKNLIYVYNYNMKKKNHLLSHEKL